MARPEDGANTDEFDNYITIQSQCQQYIDDVLGNLYYYYKDQPEITLNWYHIHSIQREVSRCSSRYDSDHYNTSTNTIK